MITVLASDYRRNFSMSRYRRNFETEVVASLEIWRAVVTVLIPLVLSSASKFITDSYEQAFWLNVFMSVLTLGVAPVLLAYGAAKRLVILVMHLTVKRGYEKQLKAFLLEVHCSLEPTLLGSWGQNFKLHGFHQSHRNMDRPTNELKIDREKFNELKISLSSLAEAPDDQASCGAELRVLDLLDGYASKLRSHKLTLEDLQKFCTLDNLVVIEDVKYLDPMVALKKELEKSHSDVLAKFVRDQKLGLSAHRDMRERLFFFYYFVTTGMLENQFHQQAVLDFLDSYDCLLRPIAQTTQQLDEMLEQLNTRVDQMLETKGVEAAPDFNMIWEARFDSFVAFEYSVFGTCHAIKVFELLCRPQCMKFTEYPYGTEADVEAAEEAEEAEAATSIPAAAPDRHPQAVATVTTATAAASKRYLASKYTVDSEVTEIEKQSLRIEAFGENTTYRAGFGPAGPEGDNMLFDTKAIAVKDRGLLVVRQYYTMLLGFTVKVGSVPYWAFYGANLDPTALVALIKTSSSNNLISFAKLPKEDCKFCDTLINFQSVLQSEYIKGRMGKLILAP